jgi:hypothetical protein
MLQSESGSLLRVPPLTSAFAIGFQRYPSLDLQVAVALSGVPSEIRLCWQDGEPAAFDASLPIDLRIEACAELAIPYLCGFVPTYELMAGSRIEGDVAAVSCLHGLSHHPDVYEYWHARLPIVTWWSGMLSHNEGLAEDENPC